MRVLAHPSIPRAVVRRLANRARLFERAFELQDWTIDLVLTPETEQEHEGRAGWAQAIPAAQRGLIGLALGAELPRGDTWEQVLLHEFLHLVLSPLVTPVESATTDPIAHAALDELEHVVLRRLSGALSDLARR